MKYPIPTAVTCTLVLLASCGRGDDGAVMPHHTPSEPTSHHAQEAGLRLDDGEKWKANEATHARMEAMSKLLADFRTSDVKDHVALGKSLREEANGIVQGCTMTGEAHNQLHMLLNPMFGDIDALAEGSGGHEEYESLLEHLDDYHSHFER